MKKMIFNIRKPLTHIGMNKYSMLSAFSASSLVKNNIVGISYRTLLLIGHIFAVATKCFAKEDRVFTHI